MMLVTRSNHETSFTLVWKEDCRVIQERYRLDKVLQDTLIPWSVTEEGQKEIARVIEIHVGSLSLLYRRTASSPSTCKS